MINRTVGLVAVAMLLHGNQCNGDHASKASGAECPDAQTLDWENFGETFATDYCTSCHSASLTGAARNGAPAGVDYDSLMAVRAGAEVMDTHAAAGPDSVNQLMPPAGSPQPTLEERELLGEWLACSAP